jgi:hypothetical protein
MLFDTDRGHAVGERRVGSARRIRGASAGRRSRCSARE